MIIAYCVIAMIEMGVLKTEKHLRALDVTWPRDQPGLNPYLQLPDVDYWTLEVAEKKDWQRRHDGTNVFAPAIYVNQERSQKAADIPGFSRSLTYTRPENRYCCPYKAVKTGSLKLGDSLKQGQIRR